MAWRDARRQRKRLLLCALSIVFGVAAMVAIESFGHNVRVAIDGEAMELLGADLQISSRTPFSERAELWIGQQGGEQSREVRFSSMALFPKNGETRLVQVRALGGGFPYYGEFETLPAGVNPAQSDRPVAVVDPLLMVQYDLKPGDTMKIGQTEFTISGEIVSVPGESAFAGIFAPRVYIPLSQLEDTGLIGFGSIAFYRVYFQLPNGINKSALEAEEKGLFAEERIRVATVESRKEAIGQSLENLTRYLGLVGFVALLLGGVGIAGAVQVYLQEKRDAVAVLRCLGASARTAFAIFLRQIVAVSIVGALCGALLGVGIQTVLPRILGPLLPFEMDFFVSWVSILKGIIYGATIALLFAFFPLLPIRRVSPLRALRAGYNQSDKKRDPLLWPLALLTAVLLTAFCMLQTSPWWQGGVFAAGLAVVLGMLWLAAWLLQTLLKTVRMKNYLLRQSLANLHRPNNRTVFIVVTLGMGAFLIYTLTLLEGALLAQTELTQTRDQPNILFFDIQEDQKEGLYAIVEDAGLDIMDEAPVVTMRLKSVKGRSVKEIKNDPANTIDDWILNREWRNSYRSEPGPAEELVAGEYIAAWNGLEEPVPISLEDDMAKDLGVEIGDELSFDVQGIPFRVKVASLRVVDWTQMRPGFFVQFPTGVLEAAPKWWIAVTKSPDTETTAMLQRAVFEAYPNISAVDLSVVIEALQKLVGRINFAIRFMALFTVATGIVVLTGAIITSRYQRVKESVLLRTLGASGWQIRAIMVIEYALLGAIAGLVGVGLALAAGGAINIWVFELPVRVPVGQSILAVFVVALLTVITGLTNSRGIANHPPLAILREES